MGLEVDHEWVKVEILRCQKCGFMKGNELNSMPSILELS